MGRFIRKIGNLSTRLSAIFNDHVRHSKLSNGIQITTQSRTWDKKLRFAVLINTGALDDPEGKEGMAHFLEHMISNENTEQEFKRRGGFINAYTNAYRVVVHGYVDNTPENQKFVLQHISQILTGEIPENLFLRERNRIFNEIGIYADRIGSATFAFLDAIFKKRDSTNFGLGTKDTLKAISRQDLIDFRKSWYVGSNIFMAFTGISKHAKFCDFVQEELKDVSSEAPPQSVMPHLSPADIRKNNGFVNQLYFGFNFPVGPITKEENAISSIAAIYLRNMVSRKISSEKGLVYSIGSFIHDDSKREGFLSIDGNIDPDNADKITPLIAQILAEACEAIDVEEFSIAKKIELDSWESSHNILPRAFHDPISMAEDIASCGRSVSVHEEEEKSKKVTREDVRVFFRKILSNQPTIIAYGDSSKLHTYNDFVRMLEEERRKLMTTPIQGIEAAPA